MNRFITVFHVYNIDLFFFLNDVNSAMWLFYP